MTLPPEKAMAYFESKDLTPTLDWKSLQDEAQAVKFTVAGITKLDVLNDIHNGLRDALANGTTLRQFQNDLEPLLQRKGWLGRGLVADEDGVLQGKKLMPYRLETIFRTNIQSSYAAGRYQQQMRTVADRPYWEYNAVMDSHTRPVHASFNGRVFAADDPIWQTLYPPNGYNCRCWVRALTRAQLYKHPVGLESSSGRMVTVQQPYGTDGEIRPVKGFKDTKTGLLLVPDAGFHLNPGRSYLAGLGQSLLEKGVTAAPELASVAVREVLTSNRLASAMNRDIHQWMAGIDDASKGDFRRVGALSPRVLGAFKSGGSLPSPVITLTAEAWSAHHDAGGGLWPRIVSALFQPLAVLLKADRLLMVVGGDAPQYIVGLVRNGRGFEIETVSGWEPSVIEGATLLDGQRPGE